MLAAMDPSWAPPVLVPIVALIMGLGFGGAQMMPWIIFPDTVDVAEMATGARPTGTYSGMMTLARKVGGALAVGFVGWVIDPFYLPKDQLGPDGMQPQEALLAIRLVLGITVAVLITIALIASFRYKITSAKLTRIRYFIEARKHGRTLTEEESQERETLVAELYGKVNPADVVEIVVDDEQSVDAQGFEGAFENVEEVFEQEQSDEEREDAQKGVDCAQNDISNVDCDDKE